MISDGQYKQFECALSDDKHFYKDPIILTACGHTACRECLPNEAVKQIKCKKCDKITERNLKYDQTPSICTEFLSTNLDNLLIILETQTTNSLQTLKSMLYIIKILKN